MPGWQHHGAILLATGASAVHGMPNFSGPGPALAAGRNCLQSLQAEVADNGIYVGRPYCCGPCTTRPSSPKQSARRHLRCRMNPGRATEHPFTCRTNRCVSRPEPRQIGGDELAG
jgi:hypothetical protein